MNCRCWLPLLIAALGLTPGMAGSARADNNAEAAFEIQSGRLDQGSGKGPEAEQHYRRAVELSPGSPEAHELLGLLLAGTDRDEAAATQLAAFFALRPYSAPDRARIAEELARMGKLAMAEKPLREALKLDPQYSPTYRILTGVLHRQGKTAEAVVAARGWTLVEPRNPEAFRQSALLLRELGKRDEALQQFRQAIALQPLNAELQYQFAALLTDAGATNDAIAAYQKALTFSPQYPEALTDLGVLYAMTGKGDKAVESLRQARELFQKRRDTNAVARVDSLLQKLRGF